MCPLNPGPARGVEEHLGLIMGLVSPTAPRRVAIAMLDPACRLARDAIARHPVPPATVSAVDGFLARREDVEAGKTLPVAGDIPAGHPPVPLPEDSAVRIMTGAVLPPGDTRGFAVVPIEDTDAPADLSLPAQVTPRRLDPGRGNIRVAGEHLAVGGPAVAAGTRCDAGTLATLIAAGIDEVCVHPAPRLALITTGDELATVASDLSAGAEGDATEGPAWSIPNSNGPMLCRLARRLGAAARHLHVADDPAGLSACLDRVAKEADLIVTVGGISAGAFDVVKACGTAATARGQAELRFYPVAMRPGKPQGAGTWRGTPMLCLPGNPVAAWVSAALFLAPAVRRLVGGPVERRLSEFPQVELGISAPLEVASGRLCARPARIDWPRRRAELAPAGGSHFVGALAGADGLAIATEKIPAGGSAPVLLV